MRRLVFLLAIISLSYSILQAQGRVDGFYKGKGNGEVGIGAGVEFAPNYFAGTNRIKLSRVITNFNLFTNYGILNNLDISFGLPFVFIGDEFNVQDGSLYLKYKPFDKSLKKGKFSMTLAGGFSTNFARYETETINAIGQRAKVLDFRPVFHFLYNSGWFITAQSGFMYKFDPVPNAINPAFKFGKASAKHYFEVFYEYLHSFGGTDYLDESPPLSFRNLGVNFHKFGATYYKPIGDQFGFYTSISSVISGRNVGQGIGVNFGFLTKFGNRKSKDN